MTDEKIICTWMEPKPSPLDSPDGVRWWDCEVMTQSYLWTPRALTLDALWEVEERLRDEQWRVYRDGFYFEWNEDEVDVKPLLHATPEQKIKALAAVLRPIVEARV